MLLKFRLWKRLGEQICWVVNTRYMLQQNVIVCNTFKHRLESQAQVLCLGRQISLVDLSNDDLTVSKSKNSFLQKVGHLEEQLAIDIMLSRASIQCI